MSKVSAMDFRAGIDHAEATKARHTEATATRHTTDLAKDEHHRFHQHLVAATENYAHSLTTARTVHEEKKTDTHDRVIVAGSLAQENERAQAAARHSSRNHETQLEDLNNQRCQLSPTTSASSTIAPPPPPPVIVDRRYSDRPSYPARHMGRGRLRYLPRSPTHPVR